MLLIPLYEVFNMYIHHQSKHWNANKWSEHWSSCYNQMFCWRPLSPGIYVDAPSWQQHSLMAVPPYRTVHLQHHRNCTGMVRWTWQRTQGVELAFEVQWCSHCQVSLPWAASLGLQAVWVSGARQTGVHAKAWTQGFPAESGIVLTRSMLFISPVIGFNPVADRCMYTC